MKKNIFICALALVPLQGCETLMGEKEDSQTGTLCLRFADVKSSIPDTNSFILSIKDENGSIVYDGIYGKAPEKIMVGAGTYDISVRSGEFDSPAFDAPLYGDDRSAIVVAGKRTDVLLECTQLNSGLKLIPDPSLPASFPGGEMVVKSSKGNLIYGYSEKRIAYFNPGPVTVLLNGSWGEKALFTRELEAQQILSIKISAATPSGEETGSGGVDIQLDTTRNWAGDSYVIGGAGGDEPDNAMSVSEAKENIGKKGVWVYGFIVGGDLSSSKCSFSPPFTSRTNIAIAAKSSCNDKEACLSVQLSKGDIRDAVNLVDNPELLGRKIYLKCDIVSSYYGIPGLQNLTEYSF